MTPAEAQMLLGVAASFDNRKPSEEAATAWAVALNGYRFVDCRDAIVAHYQRTREWIMPFDVIAGAKKIRNARIAAHPVLTPPPDLSPVASIEWRKEAIRRIGDGEVIDCDQAYGELKPRHLPDLRALTAAPPATATLPDSEETR